jgi:hypothetical protein
MNTDLLIDAQRDMREGYFDGAPGVLASATAWAVAGLLSLRSPATGVVALLLGGALIHPLGVALARALGRRGRHARGNPLGPLALEGTAWLLACIAIAVGVAALRIEWFFPAMLLAIGGRYLTFRTLYGLRLYWLLGGVLCMAGIALALAHASVPVAAIAGAVTEVLFAALLFRRATPTGS